MDSFLYNYFLVNSELNTSYNSKIFINIKNAGLAFGLTIAFILFSCMENTYNFHKIVRPKCLSLKHCWIRFQIGLQVPMCSSQVLEPRKKKRKEKKKEIIVLENVIQNNKFKRNLNTIIIRGV